MIELERAKKVNTIDEMRAELFRLKHYNPMVRNVFDTADYSGMSAEDRYTLLAYHSVRLNIELQAQMLQQLQVSPFVQKIVVPEKVTP